MLLNTAGRLNHKSFRALIFNKTHRPTAFLKIPHYLSTSGFLIIEHLYLTLNRKLSFESCVEKCIFTRRLTT